MKEIIHTKNAPEAIGPYSQGIKVGDLIFTAGQIPLIPGTGNLNNSSLEDEVNQVMSNLRGILEAAGSSLNSVVKTTIYLTDLNLYNRVNDIYGTYFSEGEPARSTVEVSGLPKDVHIEIDMIAITE